MRIGRRLRQLWLRPSRKRTQCCDFMKGLAPPGSTSTFDLKREIGTSRFGPPESPTMWNSVSIAGQENLSRWPALAAFKLPGPGPSLESRNISCTCPEKNGLRRSFLPRSIESLHGRNSGLKHPPCFRQWRLKLDPTRTPLPRSGRRPRLRQRRPKLRAIIQIWSVSQVKTRL